MVDTFCFIRKTEKYFPLTMNKVAWNVEKSGFQKNVSESFSIRTSKGRAPASELVLLKGGLPSEIALQSKICQSSLSLQYINSYPCLCNGCHVVPQDSTHHVIGEVTCVVDVTWYLKFLLIT